MRSGKDFESVRDLYQRLKEICCLDNAEKLLKMTTDNLIELNQYIDETFEYAVTDNTFSRQIFEEATKRKLRLPEHPTRHEKG